MRDSIKTAQNKKLVMCIRVRLTRFALSYFRQEKEWKREREKERKREREKESMCAKHIMIENMWVGAKNRNKIKNVS